MTVATLPAIQLKRHDSPLKIGDTCPAIEPNVHESCILLNEQNQPIGMFLKELPPDLRNLIEIADQELRSDRVKKSLMERITQYTLPNGKRGAIRLKQFSAQLGSMAPKPHLRLPYPRTSPLHIDPKANVFTKAMLKTGKLAMGLVQQYIPDVYRQHNNVIDARVPDKWRFTKFFSSTISNCNIAAPIHQDNANAKGAINLIITKRQNSKGGNLYVPDYDACFNQTNNSLLVYPAWRNRHGVTPIVPTHQGGYRNSHVWYALDSFASLG